MPKLSFVERFPDWDWVVGTGIYLDDVQAEIARMARWMIWLSLGITAALALILAFVTHQSLAIERARRAAESRLRESHERYRALVEASTEGMVLMVDGAFTYANRTFLDMTGYSASQLPLVGVDELIHAHEGEEADAGPFRRRPRAATPTAETPVPATARLPACTPGRRSRRRGAHRLPVRRRGTRGVDTRGKTLTAPRGRAPASLVRPRPRPVGVFRARWGRRTPLVEANAAARRMLGVDW